MLEVFLWFYAFSSATAIGMMIHGFLFEDATEAFALIKQAKASVERYPKPVVVGVIALVAALTPILAPGAFIQSILVKRKQ